MVAALLAGLTSVLISVRAAEEPVPVPVAVPVLETEQLNTPTEGFREEGTTEDAVDSETIESETTALETTEAESEGERLVRPYNPLRSPAACPTDIETLTPLLIRDIPNYTNRVLQRTVAVIPNAQDTANSQSVDSRSADSQSVDLATNNLLRREPYRPAFVLVAGRPELEPLDLSKYTFTTDPDAGGPLTQLFFTTLSRQYSGNRYNDVQSYHWLFLAEAEDGWWLTFMFSQIDAAETLRAPTPPRESSSGSVGQAVQLWLRDCRAGVIEALE
ncbi:MAG: hypothetical protein AAF703_18380 [Cyanobacteria bacterium P01_D01_bin.105]